MTETLPPPSRGRKITSASLRALERRRYQITYRERRKKRPASRKQNELQPPHMQQSSATQRKAKTNQKPKTHSRGLKQASTISAEGQQDRALGSGQRPASRLSTRPAAWPAIGKGSQGQERRPDCLVAAGASACSTGTSAGEPEASLLKKEASRIGRGVGAGQGRGGKEAEGGLCCGADARLGNYTAPTR
jgi:hypothetical protein